MSNKWIYDMVNDLIAKYGTRNPEKLARLLNIKIKYIDSPNTLLGMYQIIMKKRVVYLANNIGNLKNTVLAHELGHDQLHRNECIKGATFHDTNVFIPITNFELEANVFAAHLLISDEDVQYMLKNGENDKDFAYSLGVDLNLLNLKISEMAKMNIIGIQNPNEHRPSSDFLRQYKPIDND